MSRHLQSFSPAVLRCLAGLAAVAGALALGSCDRSPSTLDLDASAGLARWIPADPSSLLTADLEALVEGAGRAWKIELEHDVRNAVPIVTGTQWAARVEARPGDRLTFAYGTSPDATTPIDFLVVARPGGELFRARVEGSGHGRWHEGTVTIPHRDGRRVTVRLETTATDGSEAIGLWANPTVVPATRTARPNVLLVSIDTLRADRLGIYGYERPTSPMIDAWAERRAVVFDTAIAASPWTLPSHTTLFTGLDALRHGVNHDVGGTANEAAQPANQSLRLVAEIFREAGWRTAATTGGAYLHPKYGFAQGFDEYVSWADRSDAVDELRSSVDRALDWIDDGEDPFFLFLHTYDVHDPFRARQPHFDRLAPPEVEAPTSWAFLTAMPNRPANGFRQWNRLELRTHDQKPRRLLRRDKPLVDALYDSGVAGMDAEIGRLLDGLHSRGLDERTIVVITSDHGETLGEANRFGHIELTDETLRIPLLVSEPTGTGRGSRVEPLVRQSDIMPTILDLAGLPIPDGLDGSTLTGLMSGDQTTGASEAWSYSSAANVGLAVTVGSGARYTFDNNVWSRSLHGRGFVTVPGATRAETLAMGELRATMHDRLVEHADATAVGLRLTVRNEGPGPLHAELSGGMIRAVGTKSYDLDCSCVTWAEMNEATLEVPAGTSFTLHFEKVFGTTLRIRGRVDTEAEAEAVELDHTFSIDQRGHRDGITLGPDGWTPGAGLSGTGFEVWWHGETAIRSASPADTDPELRRQLEALGYSN